MTGWGHALTWWLKRAAFSALIICLAAGGVALAPGKAGAEAGPSVVQETIRVQVNQKQLTLQLVRIRLTDPTLRLEVVTAADGIGHDESFASMVQRTDAVAAVNGTFFNAYEKVEHIRYPNGLLVQDGDLIHSGSNPALVWTWDKTLQFVFLRMGVQVTVTGPDEAKAYTFSPWGVNKYYGDSNKDQVVWYTPEFGSSIDFPGGTKVVIRNGRVTEMTEGGVTVPRDGFVVFIGHSENNRKHLLPHIQVGARVEVKAVAQDYVDGKTLDPGEWLAAIGVGPKLVTGGKVDVDFARDGYSDPKITQQAGQRSFTGVDAEGRLVMGTVGNATIRELAEALVIIGLKEAMNMDGGASSGLYANGNMITVPGRKLSNALVVRRLAQPEVQIELNGRLVTDYVGYINMGTGSTMVPIRPFLEAMGADFDWDGNKRLLTIRRGETTIVMDPDRGVVSINGVTQTLEAPPVLVDGRINIPLRFVAETFGARVEWNSTLFRASVWW